MKPQKQESYVGCCLFLMMMNVFVFGTLYILKNPLSTEDIPDISTCKLDIKLFNCFFQIEIFRIYMIYRVLFLVFCKIKITENSILQVLQIHFGKKKLFQTFTHEEVTKEEHTLRKFWYLIVLQLKHSFLVIILSLYNSRAT